ncbi:hypothetical protein HBI82_160660 [Parastagonospora nodorum]|nr:hypothetical protein HBI82_160660 [Parastagonospora nodorum]
MKPIPAVGLSSALVQIIDFSINTLRKDHNIYQPEDASTTPVENALILQNIINNLYRLTDAVDQSELKKLQADKAEKRKSTKLSDAAQQLLKHSEDVKLLVEGLRDALISAQARGTPEDPTWQTARDALMAGPWKKKDVTSTKKKLRALRREIDTSLLLALRQYLDQSMETGLPVFAKDGSDVPLTHWEKWQNDALDAIHANDWKPSKKKNVDEFAKIVDLLVTVEKEDYFCEGVFGKLRFGEAEERMCAVEGPAEGSMRWVFEDERMGDEGGLLEWFGNVRGENLFWIRGKPGCGKTTLTRHLFRNAQIFDYLEAWSGTAPGITAAFFLWNAGTELQKSGVGLLRSILYESLQDMIYGPLEQDQGIIQWLFADRWQQFTSYGGGLHDFTFKELTKAFGLMVSDVSKKFMFMVDGLDEMDEYPSELVEAIISAAKKDNVKIIVSSCDSPELETAFEGRPNLVLDEWTKKDAASYIMNTFDKTETLVTMRRRSDNVEEMNVINTLAEKANGVFLWAKLATDFMIQGTKEDDTFTAMRFRAGELPDTLDLLVPVIVASMTPEESEQLWKVVTLLESHTTACPGLLPLSFALTSDLKATIAADTRPLKTAESTKRVDEMRAIQKSCKSLLAIVDTSSLEDPSTRGKPRSLKLTYTHRTIRSLLSTLPAPTDTTFNPTLQWSLAHLWTLKTLPAPSKIWPPLASCINASLLLFSQSSTNTFPLTYLDAVASTALTQHSKLPSFPSTPLSTFLDLAVLLNIHPYIALKTKSAEKKDVRHAIEFSRNVRKRWGRGGQEEWIGGEGRAELRKWWEKERMEVDAMLEYYGKTVRFGSAKMWVDTPEWE